jgi:hypothetical protein
MTPTGKLAAHHTGDGWELCLIDDEYNLVANIEWPWDDTCIKTTFDLISYGFEII